MPNSSNLYTYGLTEPGRFRFLKHTLSKERGIQGEKRLIFVMRDKDDSGYVYVAEVAHGKGRGDRLNVITFFKDHINTIVSHLEHKAENKERVAAFAAGGNSSRPRLFA